MRCISQKIFTILQARRDFAEALSRARYIGNEVHFQHFSHSAGLNINMLHARNGGEGVL